ncbi:hypothetical protein GRAN_1631 [Granulicella sibirica]|uniref:Uncharacterized protein n=1 Tax=Granulicella sibirica TaxID=2479048 RepID=A0A4Q0T9M1_9BACT|nr:hypothetical protein GRAN_1631 [Granulicella sibirica]
MILNRQRERLQRLIGTGLPEFVENFSYLEHRVTLDTLPTGELNGRALLPPGENPADPLYWILLDPTFFDFIYFLSNVYASAIDFKALGWLARRFAVGDESVRTTDCIRFGDERPLRDLSDLLQMFVVHGTGPVALRPFEERIFSFAEALRNQAALFVVAHEYGHIIRGDLKAQQSQQAPWLAELGADIVGWRLTNAVLNMEGTSPETRLGGAALFFMGLALLEMTRHELATGEPWNLGNLEAAALSGPKPSDSHPTALTRRARLTHEFESHFPPDQARAAEFIVGLFIDLTNQFWIRLGPNFLVLHQKGQRPKPVWKGYIGVEQGQNVSETPEEAN